MQNVLPRFVYRLVPPTIGCQIASRVGAGVVWMRGGDACVAQAHRGPFPVSTRFLVEPNRFFDQKEVLQVINYSNFLLVTPARHAKSNCLSHPRKLLAVHQHSLLSK